MEFDDRVVLVTGASKGIGRATASAFAGRGASVVVNYVDDGAAAAAVCDAINAGQPGAAVPHRADVSDAEAVSEMVTAAVDRYGRLDVLVNNAGVYVQGDAVATSETDWDRVLDINLKGAFLCAREAARVMDSGCIVNVSSEAGLVGIAGQVAYNASKSGLIGLTRSLAVDLAPDIRVNCVCPGTTMTPLVVDALEDADRPQAARRALEQARPLDRLGEPEEIAAGILLLASERAGYATGAVLSLDGGLTAQ